MSSCTFFYEVYVKKEKNLSACMEKCLRISNTNFKKMSIKYMECYIYPNRA